MFCSSLVRWFVSIPMQILLTSNVWQVALVLLVWTLKPFPFSSSSMLKIPITSQKAVASSVYSDSVILSTIKYCILLAHIIRQTEYIITYLVCKWLDNVSLDDWCCHDPSQSASTYHSNHFFV